MAVMAIGGGFLTPFLVGGTTDAQVTLFSYVILLVLGTLYLARRREWPWLNVFSYALTIVTVAAWADAYYARSKYLRTELFLTIFCALFLLALVHARRLGTAGARLAALVLASAPILYHAVSARHTRAARRRVPDLPHRVHRGRGRLGHATRGARGAGAALGGGDTAAARVDRRPPVTPAGSRRRSRRSAPCSRCTCSPRWTASRERSATSVTATCCCCT